MQDCAQVDAVAAADGECDAARTGVAPPTEMRLGGERRTVVSAMAAWIAAAGWCRAGAQFGEAHDDDA